MSDFEELLIKDNYGKGLWRASKGGNWVYISDCWKGDDGTVRVNKSKKGNPYMIRVHQDSLAGFVEFVTQLRDGASADDVPF